MTTAEEVAEVLRERILAGEIEPGQRMHQEHWSEVLNLSRQGDGGPINSTTTVVLRVYREGFGSFNMGYAATLTVVLFAVILVITIVQLRFLQRRFDY